MEEFITPIVKATKGKEELPFYSLPEFEEWKKSKDNWPSYKIKYYKGIYFLVQRYFVKFWVVGEKFERLE